jgi:UDP-2-acetamido-2,6-beta-L-arabino-hexul-4-ose reductase
MIRIGITGQSGFIGTHLYNKIGLYPNKYQRIEFKDDYYTNTRLLKEFVIQCDVIVHLAALNRHNDQQTIYNTNIELVNKLIAAMESQNVRPHVLFSSSTQEEHNNIYGNSKKAGRELLENWANKNKGQFTGLIIPNVYGPFGQPYYNSVVATFCYQLTHGENPKIEIDGELKLIFVEELVNEFIKQIEEVNIQTSVNQWHVPCIRTIQVSNTASIKVSELLNVLNEFKNNYFEKGEIPLLDDPFFRNLFNTFVCYIDHASFFPFMLKKNTDNRGTFVEVIKMKSGGQVSFSLTVPGITRGNHFHTRKAERFAVIKGKAKIDIRRVGTDKILSFELNGENPSFVDMPIWYTHNITNIGNEELFTMFWINEHFDANDPDTFYKNV